MAVFRRRSPRALCRFGGAALALAAVLWLGACAPAAPLTASPMPVGGPAAEPLGAVLFCAGHREECRDPARPAATVAMTPALWQALHEVQVGVDGELDPDAPAAVAWHYAVDGKATCVQYALEKRRALLARGVPSAALQLATAMTPRGDGHLVLIVATTGGDWVLDNLRYDVTPWGALPYRWIARQDGGSMSRWVSIAGAG
ncbi:MAG TPA: transglutaminase-like cysteine peptidase [Stellaceae bacterium]|nr:transglutaminase-like cysteine peptidase [Stellaceae bacterium]